MSTTMTTVTRITIVLFSCLMLGEAYNFAQSSSIVNINGKVFRKTVTDYGIGNRRAGVSIIATKDKGNDVRATITSSDSKTSNVDKQVKTDPTGWTGSGRRVPTTNTGTRKTPKTSAQSCQDTNAMCSSWSASGECARNPSYMKAYCKKSCGICGDSMGKKAKVNTNGCVDKNNQCGFWTKRGECGKNPTYMHKMCARSCNKC